MFGTELLSASSRFGRTQSGLNEGTGATRRRFRFGQVRRAIIDRLVEQRSRACARGHGPPEREEKKALTQHAARGGDTTEQEQA